MASRREIAAVGCWLLLGALSATGAGDGTAGRIDERAASGGATTVADRTIEAFGQPLANLPVVELRRFAFGNRLFKTSWVVAPASVGTLDGLGPLFHRTSCSGCHVRDGRGHPPADSGEPLASMLVRIGFPGRGKHGGPAPHPRYGHQLQDRAVPGIRPEATVRVRFVEIGDGPPSDARARLRRPELVVSDLAYGPLGEEVRLSPLVAPAIHGAGLLEAVGEATILALADEHDSDGNGISGRPNFVWNRLSGQMDLGRFGWKAGQPSVIQQVASAFARDIGITSSVNPREDLGDRQDVGPFSSGGAPEIADEQLEKLVFYVRTLAVPARRGWDDPEVVRGEALFARIGCAACHVPMLETAQHDEVSELSHQTLHPYTDLLLHDMGEGLADSRAEFRATGREWRTPPLWGVGLVETVNRHAFFLHDGRARGLVEAILWHGGEAEAARRGFAESSEADRRALIAFLESL